MGKTRLAGELSLAWSLAHPDERVWFCDLSTARDLKAFCGVVARSLGVAVAAAKRDAGTVERVGRTLADQGPMLLVLDNLEQVLEAAGPALGAWVRAAPEVRFLVTSRERTRLPGEVSYELTPLSLPEPGAESEAVLLFLDRVDAEHGNVRESAPLDASSLPAVAALVRRLEGIPLAIELAAARAELLGLDGLLARLGHRLDLLDGGSRDAPTRQATLRGAIAWSWDLLDEPDRRALSRAAVFRGGFTLEAADAVLGEPALPRVQSLRDKSLVRAAPRGPGGAPRFSLYEAVRELAAEKLAERGEWDLAAARHAAHYLAAGETAAASWEQTGAPAALDQIQDDLENLLEVGERRADEAPSRAAAEEALRALLVVDPVLSTRGPFGIHLELLDCALDAARAAGADPLLEARTLAARGVARCRRGHDDAGKDDLTRARERAAALGAAAVEAGILTELGVFHHRRRELDRAGACYEQALALHRAVGNRRAEGRVLGNLGALHHDEQRLDLARRDYEAALEIAASVGDLRAEGNGCNNLGLLAQERHDHASARRLYERGLAILDEVGDLRLRAITLGNLGLLHHEEGRLGEARDAYDLAAAQMREVGDRRSEALALGRLGAVLASLDRPAEARAALTRGERLLAPLADVLGDGLLAVARGFLDLALARSARVAGRAAEADLHLAEARDRLAHASAGAPSLADRSDDIRLCLRILARGLSALGDGGQDAAPPGPELLLSPDARWCRAPGGAWHDLRERHAVRRLLACLVDRQREAAGRGITLRDLQEAGWPGERILPDAASNRIYVAMNQLRKLGLKDWLRRSGEGYFLDPALRVYHTTIEPVEPGG